MSDKMIQHPQPHPRCASSEEASPAGQSLGPYKRDTIYKEDCLAAMAKLPGASIDVAIVDPPYNASKGNKWAWDNSVKLEGMGGNWEKVCQEWDAMPLFDYLKFVLAWLGELKRVVKPTGSIWIHGTYHNAGIINFALQLLEIEIINEVVWLKRNSFPNLSGRRLTASHETIIWAHTGRERQYFFNYEGSKDLACPGDTIKLPGKQMRTVWDIPNNKERRELRHGKHPTQKPLKLIARMLAISAKPGDVVLSPFCGAGSDCLAAREAGMHFLGFEIGEAFFDIARKRLAESPVRKQPSGAAAPPKRNGTKPTSPKSIPSLIKWTGSKRSQANAITDLFPTYDRYFEPFLGGGAMLYRVDCARAVCGDIYEPLIDFWKYVQSEPGAIIDAYAGDWEQLQADLPAYFYKVRDRFNKTASALDLSFLSRTCVNGIIRFNGRGAFNNSFHLSRKGMRPERFARIVMDWHRHIQGARFHCADYVDTLSGAGKGDLVYLDPPYAGNQSRYAEDLDLDRFFAVLESLNAAGVSWIVSFDGERGDKDLTYPFPRHLYKRHVLLDSGNSAVQKVLSGRVDPVRESVYLNY